MWYKSCSVCVADRGRSHSPILSVEKRSAVRNGCHASGVAVGWHACFALPGARSRPPVTADDDHEVGLSQGSEEVAWARRVHIKEGMPPESEGWRGDQEGKT